LLTFVKSGNLGVNNVIWGDSRMLQSNSHATQSQLDCAIIGGNIIAFDEILNESYLAPDKIKELRETFKHNTPYPHLVFEGLFSPVLLELIYSEFDSLKWKDWRRYDTINERKYGTQPNTCFGRAAELYFSTIHSSTFVNFLQQVTGIEGLIPDVTLRNGGLHEIPTGGKFAVHTDFNQHMVTGLSNRLVFITYLNKDWLPSYGGALELWSAEEGKCKVKVEPTFGRSILFAQTGKTLHGHPDPVNAPDGCPRRSAAVYFYSNGRPDAEESTDYHNTVFALPVTLTQREAVKYVIPPFIVDAVRKLKTKFAKIRR
jgi:Rps23 Pro-64 3,4-dihydroxylase Tpa1-like proline 4-hydroxylase